MANFVHSYERTSFQGNIYRVTSSCDQLHTTPSMHVTSNKILMPSRATLSIFKNQCHPSGVVLFGFNHLQRHPLQFHHLTQDDLQRGVRPEFHFRYERVPHISRRLLMPIGNDHENVKGYFIPLTE